MRMQGDNRCSLRDGDFRDTHSVKTPFTYAILRSHILRRNMAKTRNSLPIQEKCYIKSIWCQLPLRAKNMYWFILHLSV